LFLGDLDEAGDALGRVERSVNPFQESGDFPGAYADSIESKDGQGSLQRSSLSVGEDLGMEIPFPHARDLEVRQGPAKVRRSRLTVTVGLSGVVF